MAYVASGVDRPQKRSVTPSPSDGHRFAAAVAYGFPSHRASRGSERDHHGRASRDGRSGRRHPPAPDPAGDHVRRLGHAPVAGLAREHAEAVHPPARRSVQLSDHRQTFRPPRLHEAVDPRVERRPLHRGRAAPGDRRRGRDRARAGAARLGRGRRRGGLPGAAPGQRNGRARRGGRSSDRRHGGLRGLLSRRRRRRPGRLHHDARRHPDGARHGLRLHPTRGGAARIVGAAGGWLRREAGRPHGRRLHRGRLSVGTAAISSSGPTSWCRS